MLGDAEVRVCVAPDADAFQEQPGHGHHQHGRPRAATLKMANQPSGVRA